MASCGEPSQVSLQASFRFRLHLNSSRAYLEPRPQAPNQESGLDPEVVWGNQIRPPVGLQRRIMCALRGVLLIDCYVGCRGRY